MNTQKLCHSCGSTFTKTYQSKKHWKKVKYCSQKCSGDGWVGSPPPRSAFKKGSIPWNKGGKHSPATLAKLKIVNAANKREGTENHNWKGEKAKKSAVHMWVKFHKGNPPKCEDCGKVGKYVGKIKFRWSIHWSNIDHKYKRKLNDYRGRCPACHKKYDLEKGIATH